MGVRSMDAGALASVRSWADDWRHAGDLERRLVDAALRCIARWGLRKTTLDDIGREAGVSRATVYRVFPGGKERLVEVVLHHEIGRTVQALESDLRRCRSAEDLLVTGIAGALAVVRDHAALRTVMEHEPELVLPHFAFHRLDVVLATVTTLTRPHLARFLPEAEVARVADWVARIVLTYSANPSPAVDPHDHRSMRRFVRTYLMPGITPTRSDPTDPIDPTDPRRALRPVDAPGRRGPTTAEEKP